MELSALRHKVSGGNRLAPDEGLVLLQHADLLTLGELASSVKQRLHPERLVTFVVDRNINYTNVCVNKCRFCAFYREQGAPDAYILTRDDIFKKIEETIDLGGTQININVMNKEQILEAHKDPSKFPDLVVRVTGFSAYFASLSPEMRQFVVDRIVSEN